MARSRSLCVGECGDRKYLSGRRVGNTGVRTARKQNCLAGTCPPDPDQSTVKNNHEGDSEMRTDVLSTRSYTLSRAISRWSVRFAAGAALLCSGAVGHAAPYTWTGLGANGLWNNGTNWTGGGLPTSGTHGVYYSGSTRLSGTVNGGYTLDTLQFNSTATGSFVINGFGGPTINMRGDIVNQSGRLQTIGGTANTGRLNINYGTASGTRLIDVGTGTIALNAIIASSAGTTIEKRGAGTLNFGVAEGNSQAFTGTLALTQGTTNLIAGLPGSVAASNGTVLNLNSTQVSNFQVGSLTNSGTTVVIGNTTFSGASTLASGGTVKFSTLPNDDVSRLTFLSTVDLGGALFVDVTKTYPDANFDAPQLFDLFTFSGDPATNGNFSSVTAAYDGQTLSFAQDPLDSNIWISTTAQDGRYMVFSQTSGDLVVVPEPSTVVFAGIGGALAGWHLMKQRRARQRARWAAVDSVGSAPLVDLRG